MAASSIDDGARWRRLHHRLSRPFDAAVSRSCILRPGIHLLVATLSFLPLLIPGCGGGGSSSNSVVATSAVPGIVLEGVRLNFFDPGNPLGEKTCDVTGMVRNDTPDKILHAMLLSAVNSEGSRIAIARVERFGVASFGAPPKPTVLPGESAAFGGQLLGLHACSEVARIELTEALLG